MARGSAKSRGASASHEDFPIFFDRSQKRWGRIKMWTAVVAVCLVSVGMYELYRVMYTGDIQRAPVSSMATDQLADLLSHSNTPVVGSGPLARVVQVKGDTIYDIYRQSTHRVLTSDEQDDVDGYQYAIERYGATQNGRRLVLTFDDGPDIKYTPEILDALSEASAPATFFVVAQNVIQNQDIARRIVREGHGIANHSYSHADLESALPWVAEQEINLTQRTIRAVTGHSTTLMRPPYVGDSDQSLRNSITGMLQAQRQGLTVALYDFDTNDWRHSAKDPAIDLPPFDGQDHVLLLHDGGGDRSATVAYVKRLVKEAKAHQYTFATFHALYPDQPEYFKPDTASFDDVAFSDSVYAMATWPLTITKTLFVLTVGFVFVGLILYVVFAFIQRRRTSDHTDLERTKYQPAVAVIIPAYNEEKVLRSCIKGLRRSHYKKLQLIIVDDGSKDRTWSIAKRLAARYPNVKAYRQENAGKAAAINNAIRRTRCPIIIGIDADTVFLPDTVDRLVRHFDDPSVGAVAGMVRVGNTRNVITYCQALEYSTSICLERTAQAYMGAIMVVPGACGAWRRRAVVHAGRYSSVTLAEDCDMTIAVHTAGYKVIQDNTAISVTEAPETLHTFAKQRFRWAFGNIQVYWKHRRLLLRRNRDWLNTLVLPLAVVSTVGPLLFLPFLGFVTAQNVIAGNYILLITYWCISLGFQYVRAVVALMMDSDRQLRLLFFVPIARLFYGPLRVYLIYGTILRAFRGDAVGWNKLVRVGLKPQSRRTARVLKPLAEGSKA